MKHKIVLLLMIALGMLSCQKSQKEEAPQLSKGIKEISKNDYSIHYDSSFRLDESGRNGVEFYLFAPTESADDFAENINLMIQDLSTVKYDLDKFVLVSEKQIKASGELIESSRMKKNGQEYHRLLFKVHLNGLDLQFLQYDFVKNDKAYVLTFSAKQSEFDSYQKEIVKVMNSFELK